MVSVVCDRVCECIWFGIIVGYINVWFCVVNDDDDVFISLNNVIMVSSNYLSRECVYPILYIYVIDLIFSRVCVVKKPKQNITTDNKPNFRSTHTHS